MTDSTPEPAAPPTARVIRFPDRATEVAQARRQPPLTGRGRLYVVLGLACLLPSTLWLAYALTGRFASGQTTGLVDFALSALSLVGLPILLGWVLLMLGLRQRHYDWRPKRT